MLQGGADALFVKSLCSELWLVPWALLFCTDSSAARAMATCKGVGGVKHLIRMFWLLEKTKQNNLIIEKVNMMVNWKKTLTKCHSANRLNTLMKGLNLEFRDGRLDAPKFVRKSHDDGCDVADAAWMLRWT